MNDELKGKNEDGPIVRSLLDGGIGGQINPPWNMLHPPPLYHGPSFATLLLLLSTSSVTLVFLIVMK
jgi:hypothetical protein